MLLVVDIVVFVAIGFLVGRALVLAVPLTIWSGFFAGVAAGWWGSGLGDAWEYALALTLCASLAASAAGLVARRAIIATRASQSTHGRPPA
jgi:hypothetical protein